VILVSTRLKERGEGDRRFGWTKMICRPIVILLEALQVGGCAQKISQSRAAGIGDAMVAVQADVDEE
jgi:hypothetical protein